MRQALRACNRTTVRVREPTLFTLPRDASTEALYERVLEVRISYVC